MSQAGQAIVERVDPVDLRWGEISLASGTRVSLPAPEAGQPQSTVRRLEEYPFFWRLEFTEGRRVNKTPGESGDRAQIHESVRVSGSFLIAAAFTEGREQAKLYERELAALAQKTDLHSLKNIFSFPSSLVEWALAAIEGDAQLLFCVDSEEYTNSYGVATRSGARNSVTTSVGTDPDCEVLRRSAAKSFEIARYRMGYELLSSMVETVRVEERAQLDNPAMEWPRLVTRKETEADSADGWFTKTRSGSGESVSTESLPLTEEDRVAGRTGPRHVLEVRLKDGPMPPSFARGRGVILRFEGSRVERRLGAKPEELARQHWSSLVALLLLNAAGELNSDRFIDLAAAEWAAHAGPLPAQAFFETTSNVSHSIGHRDLLAIFCPEDPDQPPGARYCQRYACAEIANGGEFCEALEKEFNRR